MAGECAVLQGAGDYKVTEVPVGGALLCNALDCFATLAMTVRKADYLPVHFAS
jgi:hypothetical protein